MKRVALFFFCLLLTGLATGQVRFGNDYSDKPDIDINYGRPVDYEIAEIKVEGAEFLDENAIVSISGLKVGDRIKVPGEELSNALKRLWRQGILGDVQILATKTELGQIWLTIKLEELPRLSKVQFEGLNHSQKTELNDKVKLIRGRILTQPVIKNAEIAVEKHFIDKGYLNVDAKMVQETDSVIRNGVILLIDVDLGQKVKIDRITIKENEQFSDAKLKGKFKNLTERPRISIFKDIFHRSIGLVIHPKQSKDYLVAVRNASGPNIKSYLNEHVKLNIFKSAKYSKTKLEEDKNALIGFYNSKGYRDAVIVEDTLITKDEDGLEIVLTVDEGQKYYFGKINWIGNYIYTDEQLSKVLGVEEGDVYDLDLINKKLNYNPQGQDISSLYMDNGYLAFEIDPVEVRIENDSIDVEMRLREGNQFTINNIIISGNDRTNDHVVRREIRTLPGQKFSRELLIRTNRELAQLGYFDPEQIGIQPYPNMGDNTVDIEYTLVEKPSDQIELSGGWGGNFGFVGTLGLSFNNFSIRNITKPKLWRPLPVGDGQRLAVRMQANGRRYQNYSLTFSEPWLGGSKPNSFTFNVSHAISRINERIWLDPYTGEPLRDENGALLPTPGFNEFTGSLRLTSVSVGLGRRVTWPDDYFVINNSIAYTTYDLFNFGNQLGFRTGVSNSLTFNTTIARNSVDNPMYPRRGSMLSIATSLTPPWSSFNDKDYTQLDNAQRYNLVEYHKWNIDLKQYINVVGNLVVEARAHFGMIGSYNDEVGIGPFERFQMGGSGLTGQNNILIGTDIVGLRGYEDNRLTPPNFGLPSSSQGEITGGVAFTKYVMELRYPVSLNPSATIYLLGFAEAGNNFGSYRDYNPFDLYRSAGFGARIFMPAFGLLGVDWAYGFDAIPGQNISGAQFHFTIGQQIR